MIMHAYSIENEKMENERKGAYGIMPVREDVL